MSTPISIHQRNYQTEAFDEGNGTMRVVGRLTDTKPQGIGPADGAPLVIHDMVVEIIVAGETFEILDVTTRMLVRPYDECPTILDKYRQLVGSSIARGYSRLVKDLFGGPGGCSHIGALLIALGPVAIQASWGMNRTEEPSPEEIARRLRMNTDTCHVWRQDGEKIQMLRRGEQPTRPNWEQSRRAELVRGDVV